MNVIQVLAIIPFVANQMFPKTVLPDGQWLSVSFRKSTFNQPPACGEIVIIDGQSPDTMEVVGQDDGRVDFEGIITFYALESLA